MWRQLINMWKSNNLLEQAWKQSFEMLDITQNMFLESVRVLRESDVSLLKKDIRDRDKVVNEYQQDVRRKVMTHCALQGSKELAGGLILVSIVIDIERIGDYIKNIVDLAMVHPERLLGGIFESSLQKIETAVKDNFLRTREYLETSNIESAAELLKQYAWVNPECDQRTMELIQQKDRKIHSGDAATLVLYFRSLKRINSHLRNITTSIVNPFDMIGFKPENRFADI